MQSPLGIETTTPHFSWKNMLTHNNQQQKAYEIQVASDSAALAKGRADIWESGRMESDEQIMVAYTGTPLQERQLYYWHVRTWDEYGTCSGWSEIERFGVGILGKMNGQYIGCKQGNGLAPTPMLTKRFNIKLQKGKTKVLAHINSLGYHELIINSTKVGEKILQPAVSQLDKHSLIVAYDITPYLRNGENEITIWLGQGWYRNNIFGVPFDGPLVKAEICEIANGASKTIVQTDTSWQASPSGYSYTGTWMPLQFGGERFDANFQPQWQPATACNVEGMRTSPQLERMGYGGDGNSSTMTLQTIYDVLPTYLNWLTAWGKSIDNDGSLAYVAPSFPTGGGPYWCGFIIKAPWRTYLN